MARHIATAVVAPLLFTVLAVVTLGCRTSGYFTRDVRGVAASSPVNFLGTPTPEIVESGVAGIPTISAIGNPPTHAHSHKTIELRTLPVDQRGTQGVTIELGTTAFVLGVVVALPEDTALFARQLRPLDEIRVLATGILADGSTSSTVRAVVARATYRTVRVAEGWFWIDLSMLGQVNAVQFHVVHFSTHEGGDTPLGGPLVLIDSVTYSDSIQLDDRYFTIALLPDTQKYAERFPEILLAQTRYLRESAGREKIAFVSHLGDIVEDASDDAQWRVADLAMAELDGVVPYGIVVGNHDYTAEFRDPSAGSPKFQQSFPESRFARYPWHGGRSPDSLSSFQLVDAGPWSWLWLHLSVDTPPDTLEWVRQVLAEHPERPVVVTTHVYLRENGRIPKPWFWSGDRAWHGLSSEEFFAQFVVKEDRVFMVLCGHVSAEHMQVSLNDTGRPVIEMLQNYQNRQNGGEGFLRLMRFYPEREEIRVLTYSPWLDEYEVDHDSHFTISLEFAARFAQ